jgi:hypothetical protein
MRMKLIGTALLILVGATALAAGCSATPAQPRLCTPGAYVFCRCQDLGEGTKLCNTAGDAFETCDCGNTPKEDSGFEPFDAGPDPEIPPVSSIPASCTGKIAVIAGPGGAVDGKVFTGIYKGNNAFTVGNFPTGPGIRDRATILTQGTDTFIAAYRGRFDSLVSIKYVSSWSAPFGLGITESVAAPEIMSFATTATAGKLVYMDMARGPREFAYSATGWSDASISAAPVQSAPIPVPRSLATAYINGAYIGMFVAADDTLQVYSRGATFWNAASKIGTIKTAASSKLVQLAAMDGGANDAIAVYESTSLNMQSVTRSRNSGSWTATPLLVDSAAKPSASPALVGIGGGKALLVWRSSTNGSYSVFDPSKTPVWSAPKEFTNGVPIVGAPAATTARCGGAEASVVYAGTDGKVFLTRFVNGAFTDALEIAGMDKAVHVGVGELP